jgi:hypothetical protein
LPWARLLAIILNVHAKETGCQEIQLTLLMIFIARKKMKNIKIKLAFKSVS